MMKYVIFLFRSTKSSDYFVVLDTIRTSISFQKGVADGWIKVHFLVPPATRPSLLCQHQRTIVSSTCSSSSCFFPLPPTAKLWRKFLLAKCVQAASTGSWWIPCLVHIQRCVGRSEDGCGGRGIY